MQTGHVPSARPVRRWFLVVALLPTVVGIAFAVRSVTTDGRRALEALSSMSAPWVGAAGVLGAIGMLGHALVWSEIAGAAGGTPRRRAVELFFLADVAKYSPGGVLSVVGRAEATRREGTSRVVAYSAVLTSTGYGALVAVLLAAMTAPFAFDTRSRTWWAIAAAAFVALLAHGRGVAAATRLVPARLRDLERSIPVGRARVRVVALSMMAWLAVGSSTWALTHGLGTQVGFPPILVATCVAWVAGLLAVPAPSGLGVREAVFVWAAPALPISIAALVALAARALFLVIDLAAAVVAVAVHRSTGTQTD